MIDAKAGVALERVAQVLPERVDAFGRMHCANRVDPALRDQPAKSFAHLGPEQRVVYPALRRVGRDSSSQRNRVGSRAVMPLTLKVAIFTRRACLYR
jgi:hypothetical protein